MKLDILSLLASEDNSGLLLKEFTRYVADSNIEFVTAAVHAIGRIADAMPHLSTRILGGRIVSIGTTSLRLLETVAREHDGALKPWSGETDIFITPGFQFRAVDLLLTNFHLPRSTLFMLVSAFAGLERMKQAYAHAVEKRYRFYSYGECCLLRR